MFIAGFFLAVYCVVSNNEGTQHNATDSEWVTYVKDHPDIGIFTIACLYNESDVGFFNIHGKSMLFLILIVQLVVPSLVFDSQYSVYLERYGDDCCPATAERSTKVLGFFIGALYVAKGTFLLTHKMTRPGETNTLKYGCIGKPNPAGKLCLYVMVDRFMHIVYEFLVYLLNLWIVYIAEEPLDMVLNALAMEFILQLDDEVKGLYMEIYPPTETTIQKYKDANDAALNCFWFWFTVALQFVGILIPTAGLGALIHFGAVIIPFCKV